MVTSWVATELQVKSSGLRDCYKYIREEVRKIKREKRLRSENKNKRRTGVLIHGDERGGGNRSMSSPVHDSLALCHRMLQVPLTKLLRTTAQYVIRTS